MKLENLLKKTVHKTLLAIVVPKYEQRQRLSFVSVELNYCIICLISIYKYFLFANIH